MSLNLKQNKSFLEFLATSNPLQQKALLITSTPSQVHSICECIINVLYGIVPLDGEHHNAFKAHRKTLYTLADSVLPYADKKKLLVQEGGGFLNQLLPVILPALSLLI